MANAMSFCSLKFEYDISLFNLEINGMKLAIIILYNDFKIAHILVRRRKWDTVNHIRAGTVSRVGYLYLRAISSILKQCVERRFFYA